MRTKQFKGNTGSQAPFSERLRQQLVKQASLISHPGNTSDINPRFPDPNPIIDAGFPRIVDGIACAAALCNAMSIPVKPRVMEFDPCLHGYGKNYSDAEVTIGIWDLRVTDICGTESKIPLYITKGGGFLSSWE